MRRLLALLCGFYIMTVSAAQVHCPMLSDISRTNGEYAWQSKGSLWEGYFALPRVGIGQSSEITTFLDARWVQLTDLANPLGFVECDYAGNVPGEVIRFTLVTQSSGPKPNGYSWSCSFAPPFPSAQCSCGGEPTQCVFEQ